MILAGAHQVDQRPRTPRSASETAAPPKPRNRPLRESHGLWSAGSAQVSCAASCKGRASSCLNPSVSMATEFIIKEERLQGESCHSLVRDEKGGKARLPKDWRRGGRGGNGKTGTL
uniref:Uncharacterized protein n=1 Tax=Sphaerodactylus townsendi TaxID=933632 RepID=A0ACB8EHD5_9SAUR